jgi:hypothetical protein
MVCDGVRSHGCSPYFPCWVPRDIGANQCADVVSAGCQKSSVHHRSSCASSSQLGCRYVPLDATVLSQPPGDTRCCNVATQNQLKPCRSIIKPLIAFKTCAVQSKCAGVVVVARASPQRVVHWSGSQSSMLHCLLQASPVDQGKRVSQLF